MDAGWRLSCYGSVSGVMGRSRMLAREIDAQRIRDDILRGLQSNGRALSPLARAARLSSASQPCRTGTSYAVAGRNEF